MENDTTPATKADIRRLDDRMEKLDACMQVMEGKFEILERKVDGLDGRFESLEHRLDQRFDYLDKYIGRILDILVNDKNRLDEHEKRLTRLETHAGIAA